MENTNRAILKTFGGLTLMASMASAHAGTWSGATVASELTQGNTNAHANTTISSSAIAGSQGNNAATMTVNIQGSSSVAGPAITSGTGICYKQASFLIKWKQDYVGETPPAGITAHHSYSYSFFAQKSVTGTPSVKTLGTSANISILGSGYGGSVAGTNGPNLVNGGGVQESVDSFPANWEFDAVDAVGRITYRTTSPVYESPRVSYVSQVWLMSAGGGQTSASAGASEVITFTAI